VPNPVQFDIAVGSLPEGLDTDPQGLLEAFAARLIISPSVPWSSFVLGAAQPTSDLGPWFKNGQTLWVWDDGLATYIPQVIDDLSLRYKVAAADPGVADYQLWIDTATPAVKWSNGAVWTDVIAARLAAYSTTAQMNAAIAAAVSGVSFNAYVGVATLNVAQSVPVDATPHKMTLDTVQINASGAVVLATSRYVAPAPGVYQVVCNPQFDNDTGVAATMEVITSLYKNGSIATEGIGGFDGTPSPTGGRWNGGFTGLIQLATNDFIEVWVTLQDGTNTGAVDLTTWDFSVHRVSS
jgi:hypothetical protein